MTLPEGGCAVFLNADGVAGMTVEAADDRFGPLPGFSGDDSATAGVQDGLDRAVRWPKADLAILGGRTVRFRVSLRDTERGAARLFAITLRAGDAAAH